MTYEPTDEMVEAVARSDADFDGRPLDRLGRADRDRYMARARAAIAVAAPLILEQAAKGPTERVRHIKRGSTYRVLHRGAELQIARDVVDGTDVVIYQGEADGRVWVRPEDEFDDGRFEPAAIRKLGEP